MIRVATLFLPPRIMRLMNIATCKIAVLDIRRRNSFRLDDFFSAWLNSSTRPNGRRASTFYLERLVPYLLRPCSRLSTPLVSKRAAHDVVAHAGQVPHATAAHKHNAVLLQIVAFATDVGGDFYAIRQAYARHLAKRRIRFLRRHRLDLGADPAFLRGALSAGANAVASKH